MQRIRMTEQREQLGGAVRRSKRLAVRHGYDDEREHESKRGKHGTVSTDECESVEQQHEQVQTHDGLRRSKRVAERMTGAEGDSQHAHKRGKHESVIAYVDVSIEPWRDK